MTRIPETALHHYPTADARCDCEATHTWDGAPCISVRRANGQDRCLECNTCWPTPGQASLDLTVPCPKFTATGRPCSPADGTCAACGNRSAA